MTILIINLPTLFRFMNCKQNQSFKSLNNQTNQFHQSSKSQYKNSSFKSKMAQIQTVIFEIARLEKQAIQPITHNPYLLPFIPIFNPLLDYHHELLKLQAFHQISYNTHKKLDIKIQALKNILIETDTFIETNNQTQKDSNSQKNIVISQQATPQVCSQIPQKFRCPYQQCDKYYFSEISLNFHIKNKHSGGNKKDRLRLAKKICDAQLKGLPLPDVNVRFPPGFLQEYRADYFNIQKKEKVQKKVRRHQKSNKGY